MNIELMRIDLSKVQSQYFFNLYPKAREHVSEKHALGP